MLVHVALGVAGVHVHAGDTLREGGSASFRCNLKTELLSKSHFPGLHELEYTFFRDREPVPSGRCWEEIEVGLMPEDDDDARRMNSDATEDSEK